MPGLSTVRAKDLMQFMIFLKIALRNDGRRDFQKDLNSLYIMSDEKSHFIVKFTILNTIIVESTGINKINNKE
jgi:hypothetical protein